MLDFIRLARKRGTLADILHAVFNFLFAGVVFAAILVFPDNPWFALALILLAKWRIFAVRPRYWWVNFLGGLPDLLLGFGVVILMWQAGEIALASGNSALIIQIFLALFYAAWLIFLKPQHKHKWILLQAAVSQFVALAAIFSISQILPLFLAIILAFISAFSAARQILFQREEKSATLLALIWGIAVAEISFVAWHWAVAYQISPLLKIPQIAILATVLGFVMERAYAGWRGDKKIEWREFGPPLIFAILVILLLIFGFGGLWI